MSCLSYVSSAPVRLGAVLERSAATTTTSTTRVRQPRECAEHQYSRDRKKRSSNLSFRATEPTGSSQPNQEPRKSSRLNEVVKKLAGMGPPGIAAYGLLNSLYYTGVVAFIFLLQRPTDAIGLQAGARKLGEAFLSAWALSQLTKVPRALGAIALAPVTNTFMTWLIEHTWIENRRQGLIAIALACLVVVATVMGCLLLTVM